MYSYKDTLTKDITIALAHEVKSPISLIKANIEFLELENVLDNHKKNVSLIKSELNKISEIVSDFMVFCSQNYEMNLIKINLLDIIKSYIGKFNVYSNITFSLNCFNNTEDITIIAGYSKISINNNQGHIETNVYIKDNNIIVDIIDSGNGIDDDIFKKVHEPFFTNKSNGSGLGIPICINAMKSINGNFEIFNNKGCGCTTRLTFKNHI